MSVWRRVRREAEARSAEWSASTAARKAVQDEEEALIASDADAWDLALLYYRRLTAYAGGPDRVWESKGDAKFETLEMRIPPGTVKTTTGGGPTGQWSDVDSCMRALLAPHGFDYSLFGSGATLSMIPTKLDAIAQLTPALAATALFAEKLRNQEHVITIDDVLAYIKDTGMLARSTPTPGQLKFITEICLPELNTQRNDMCFIGLKRIPDGGTPRRRVSQ